MSGSIGHIKLHHGRRGDQQSLVCSFSSPFSESQKCFCNVHRMGALQFLVELSQIFKFFHCC